MKKSFSLLIVLFGISLNLFAEITISTNELKKGIHYSVDSSVNIRKEPSFASAKIGKVNLGDLVEVLEKTDVYFESEGICDCFYKVKTDFGIGYMFGGYISDNADTVLFDGKNQTYFDKLYNFTIRIPKKINETDFFRLLDDNQEILFAHYKKEKNNFVYFEYAYEEPSLETLIELEKILHSCKGDFTEHKYAKAVLFTLYNTEVVKRDFKYSKISDIKLVKNQFKGTSFVALEIQESSEPYYVDATAFITFQNGVFLEKRRFSKYARDGRYLEENIFVMPGDKGGEKDTVRIIGKYIEGNEVTEKYDVKIFWNGKDFEE